MNKKQKGLVVYIELMKQRANIQRAINDILNGINQVKKGYYQGAVLINNSQAQQNFVKEENKILDNMIKIFNINSSCLLDLYELVDNNLKAKILYSILQKERMCEAC
jgi:hypothetical protein